LTIEQLSLATFFNDREVWPLDSFVGGIAVMAVQTLTTTTNCVTVSGFA
jgi:hypothetical protein